MPTQPKTSIRIRRPLTVYYIGRPASLYIDALANRRRAQSVSQPSPDGTADQATSA